MILTDKQVVKRITDYIEDEANAHEILLIAALCFGGEWKVDNNQSHYSAQDEKPNYTFSPNESYKGGLDDLAERSDLF